MAKPNYSFEKRQKEIAKKKKKEEKRLQKAKSAETQAPQSTPDGDEAPASTEET
jgi:hypothetical protein